MLNRFIVASPIPRDLRLEIYKMEGVEIMLYINVTVSRRKGQRALYLADVSGVSPRKKRVEAPMDKPRTAGYYNVRKTGLMRIH